MAWQSVFYTKLSHKLRRRFGVRMSEQDSPLERLEEAIKNRHNTNIVEWRAKHPDEPMTMFEQCACDLENQFRKVEVEFVAFQKQNMIVSLQRHKELKDKIISHPYFNPYDWIDSPIPEKFINALTEFLKDYEKWLAEVKELLQTLKEGEQKEGRDET